MAKRNLPTRDSIIEILTAQKGNGKAAMVTALDALKTSFPDMEDEEFARIVDDVGSYQEYQEEVAS